MNVAEATDANFEQLLSQHSKVVVKYYADWCGYCQLFLPQFEHLAGLEQYQSLTFVKVNAEANPGARRRGKVNHLPFFAAFQQGQLVNFMATNEEQEVSEMLNSLRDSIIPA